MIQLTVTLNDETARAVADACRRESRVRSGAVCRSLLKLADSLTRTLATPDPLPDTEPVTDRKVLAELAGVKFG